jgi:hypothetical protein
MKPSAGAQLEEIIGRIRKDLETSPAVPALARVDDPYVPVAFSPIAISYRRRSDGGEAFRVYPDRIDVLSLDDRDMAKLVDVMVGLGWSSVSVSGREDFCRKSWLMIGSAGIGVSGHVPTETEEIHADTIDRALSPEFE